MARYMFITWDGSGNQTPTLGMAQALRERGHDIVFAGYESLLQGSDWYENGKRQICMKIMILRYRCATRG